MVYHEGQDDELTTEGIHEVPEEVKDLWTKCQAIKRSRRNTTTGHPRGPAHHFPFSWILTCHHCGSPYYGESHRDGEQPFDCPTSGGGLEDTVSRNLAPGRSMPWWTRWVTGSCPT